MKKLIYFIFMSCFFFSLSAQDKTNNTVKIKIKNGFIEGFTDSKSGLNMFFGIPYAKPPVGDLRWKEPQPPDNWEGVLVTKKFGPRCVQAKIFGDMNFRSDTMSEDCLYLNVWTPSASGTKKGIPVLVYFHGGGFVAGDGSEPRYDGASMAKKGIVVVTVNYRMHVFGFLAHPELSAESPYKASGNYGLLDQNAALKWVQKNISAFGGDPAKVTIAGESAGSISVSGQMASPLSKGLFAGAIGESGAAINPTLFPVPLEKAEKEGESFVKQAGYKSLADLRKLSTEELFAIYQKSGRFGFSTVIDGYFYTKSLPEIFEAGEQAQVPLLVGWNSAEIDGRGFMFAEPFTKEGFIKRAKSEYRNDYQEVLNLYPHETDKEVELSAAMLASDRFIVYSTWKWFDLHRKNSKQPVYRYLFSKIRPPLVDTTLSSGLAGGTQKKGKNDKLPEPVGAAHASEIEYCMGNLYLTPEYAWEKADYNVSETMLGYFANFVLKGDPNGKGLVKWSPAASDDNNPPVMNINIESKETKAVNDKRFLFLDKLYMNK